MRALGPARGRARWFGLVALVVSAGALSFGALAWACNPQAYLTLDKAVYAPGDNVRVSGSFFKNEATITVSIDKTGQSVAVTTSGNGAFSTTFALPASAPVGGYTVQAVGYEANGQITPGLPARGSFSVAAAVAAPAAAPAAPQASAPQASAPSQSQAPAPAQASRPVARPSSSRADADFREPSIINEPNVQTSRAPGSSVRVGGSSGSESAVSSGGRAVFGGSVAPAVSAAPVVGAPPVVAAPASRSRAERSAAGTSRAVGASVAERTAADDVWSAVGAGSAPSVLPFAGDGVAVSSPRSGSQLALGLVLLGGGVLALVGGLAAGEARRRRVSTR